MEPVLRQALAGPCRVPAGSRLLVAVSGGADSTALLLSLHRLAKEFGYTLTAAHLHHGLRGKEADGDQAAVRRLCRGLGVPLLSARWDTRARMRSRGLSGQAGLRRLRREFLRRAARRAGAAAIATAHHAEDQLETLLARLLRGAGLAGLGAMSPRRGVWLKPLLGASRRDIEQDLRRAGIAWREDSSNRDPRYLRSRLRQQAIPALLLAAGLGGGDPERARSELARRVGEGLREVRQARRLIDRMALELLRRARPTGRGVDLVTFARAPRLVRASALRLLWRGARPGVGLTGRHLAALLALAAPAGTPGHVPLPRGWTALRQGRLLELRGPEEGPGRGRQSIAAASATRSTAAHRRPAGRRPIGPRSGRTKGGPGTGRP